MDLTAIMNKILARALVSTRGQCVMPMSVNQDYSDTLNAQFGDTINVPIPATVGTLDIVPGDTPQASSAADITPTTVPVVVNKWKGTKRIILTDHELKKVDATADFLPSQIKQGAIELIEEINLFLLQEAYRAAYTVYGTAGTTPFGSGVGTKTFSNAMRLLDKAKVPSSDRQFVMDADAKAAALELDAVVSAERAGQNQTLIAGQFATDLWGLTPKSDVQVPTHVKGTAASITCTGDHAAGTSSVLLRVASGTGTLVPGDIITFTGHTQTYAVTNAHTLTTTAQAVAITPPLAVAIDGDPTPVNVALTANHVANIAFHKSAIAFVTRVLTEPNLGADRPMARKTEAMRDDETGIAMRLSLFDGYHQYAWQLDVLYGAKVIKPEHVIRMFG